MSKFSCTLVVFSILLLLKEATADQIPITVLPSVAMVPVPGSPGLFAQVRIDVPITGTHFNKNDGRMGCTKNYDYATVTAGPTWPVNHMGRAYVEADVIRYWDWTYDGYDREGGGALDFTQNCHGYAFGVGDWPNDSTALKGQQPNPCWVPDVPKATIADCTTHTVKIETTDCKNSLGIIVSKSSEKFRESGYYRQTSDCTFVSKRVDLTKGNGVRAGLNLIPYKKQ
jgi:hypothetical protein